MLEHAMTEYKKRVSEVRGGSKARPRDPNERRAQLIVDTLASFGVDARVSQINEGPTITQFGVEPGWDVRTKTVVERDATGLTLLDEDGDPRTKEIEVSRTADVICQA